jgi:protocatechuate 3,4-dioxygenase beta subunit
MRDSRTVLLLAGIVLIVVAAGLWFGLRDGVPAGGGEGDAAGAAAPAVGGGDAPRPAPHPGGPAAARRPGSVAGRILLLATGEPVAGVLVTLSVGDAVLRCVTRTDGRFWLKDVPSGEGYALAVEHGEFARVERPGIVVLTGEETDVGDLLLAPAVTLLVRVMDGAGAPIPKAEVTVFASGGPRTHFGRNSWREIVFSAMSVPVPLRTAVTDASGEASIPGLAAGRCFVVASAEGFGRAGADALLAPGQGSEPVVVRLGKGFPLSGRVTDEKGDPVAGRVILEPSVGGWPGSSPALRRDTAIDAGGSYRFEGLAAGTVLVSVTVGDRPPVRSGLIRVPEVPVFDIHLGAGAILSGTVTDEAGAPVAGAEVRVLVMGALTSAPTGTAATTDDEGRYRFEGLPRGYLNWLGVTAEGFVAHPPPGTPVRTLPVSGDTEVTMDIVLVRGSTLSGLVTVAETGEILPGARIIAFPLGDMGGRDDSTVTGEDGRYRFPALAPGEYLMRVEADGYCQPGPAPDRWGRMPYMQEIDPSVKVRIGKDASPAEKDLTVERGGSVAGRVEDGLARPVAGVRVTASARGSAETAISMADGTFRIAGLAEARELWVVAERGGDRAMHGPVPLAAGGEIDGILLTLKAGGRVSGIVEVADGASPAGGGVRSENSGPRWGDAGAATPVADDGAFTLEGVSSGNVVLVAVVPGYPPGRSDPVTVPEGGEVAGVRIRVAAGLSLTGSVELRSGGPVSGAQIRVHGGTGSMDGATMAQSDAEGKFTITGLAAGRYGVTAWRDGYTSASRQNVDPEDGEPLVLVMEVGGEIAGRVEDESGGPISGVLLSASGEDGRSPGGGPASTSGRDGSFRIGGLPDGTYRVTAGAGFGGQSSNWIPEVREGVRPGDPPLLLRLRAGLRIAGRVRGSDGEPLGGLGIYAQRDGDETDRSAGMIPAQTALDGSFELGGLTPGTFAVTVQGFSRGYPEVTKRGVPAGAEGLEFVMGAGREIAGSVTGPGGDAVSGAQVSAQPAPGTAGTSRQSGTGADGVFRIQGLAPGVYTVTVSAPGRFATVVVEDVPAGTTGLSVAMVEGRSISGLLALADGSPLPKVTVTARPAGGGPAARADSDAEGKWKIPGLGEGRHVLDLVPREDGYRLREGAAADAGAEDVRLVAVEGLTISGTVTDRRSRAIQNAMLLVEEGGGPWVRTGADGGFTITGLDPGEYRISIWAPGAGRLEVKARAGDQALDIRLE